MRLFGSAAGAGKFNGREGRIWERAYSAPSKLHFAIYGDPLTSHFSPFL